MARTFDDFFRSNYPDVVRGVRASGATDDVAADAAQEAFIRAYPRWWRLRRYQNPAAWVQRVAINVSRDLHRSEKRYERVLTDLEVEAQLERAGKTVELAGLRAAKAYRGQHSPASMDDVGIKLIKRGATRTVITGGHNMLRPELSSPLRPETVSDPSTYELSWLDLDKLTLKSKGTSPQGWVNRNAYLFTFTRSVSP